MEVGSLTARNIKAIAFVSTLVVLNVLKALHDSVLLMVEDEDVLILVVTKVQETSFFVQHMEEANDVTNQAVASLLLEVPIYVQVTEAADAAPPKAATSLLNRQQSSA